MFNGIEHIADRGDLLDRMLLFRLPKIEGAERLTASNLNQQFHRIEGRIFGALLDAVAVSMREYPNVKLDKPPRMADFAIHSIAASSALGFTQAEFTEAYENNRSELRHVAIEGSVTAVEVIEWFNRVNVMTGTVKREWQGTHKELLGELGRREGLPRTARGLQAELARVEPNLIAAGVVLTRLQRESGTGRRPIKLTRTVEHQSVVDVAAIQAQEQREAQARAASDAAEAERQRAWAEKDKLREERKAERLAHCKRWLTEFLTEPKKKHATLNAGKTAPFYFDKTELERARTELSLGEELRPDGKYWLPLGSEPKSEVHFFTGTSAIH
jgi:hypothetical protein